MNTKTLHPPLNKDNGWSQTFGCITFLAHCGILCGLIVWITSDLNSAIPWFTYSAIVITVAFFGQYFVYWRKLRHFVPPGVEFTLIGSIFLMISSWLEVPNNTLSYVIGITILAIGTIRFTYVYWYQSQNGRGF